MNIDCFCHLACVFFQGKLPQFTSGGPALATLGLGGAVGVYSFRLWGWVGMALGLGQSSCCSLLASRGVQGWANDPIPIQDNKTQLWCLLGLWRKEPHSKWSEIYQAMLHNFWQGRVKRSVNPLKTQQKIGEVVKITISELWKWTRGK